MEQKNEKKIKLWKIVFSIIAIVVIIGLLIYLFPVMKNLSTRDGQIAFKDKVNSLGIGGVLILFGLQVAQIFLFIIPGEPIEILAGMCYGAWWGTIFILISSCIVSMLIFGLVRKLGRKFVYNFSDKERINRIENSKLFKNPQKIEYIMLALFLIPGTPKDLLVYIAGLLPIRFRRFIIISTLARTPSVVSSTLAGANIAVGDLKKSFVLYITIFIVVAILIYVINKFDKDKTTEEALKVVLNGDKKIKEKV